MASAKSVPAPRKRKVKFYAVIVKHQGVGVWGRVLGFPSVTGGRKVVPGEPQREGPRDSGGPVGAPCTAELYVNHNLQSCTVPAAVETGTQASGVSGVLTDLGGGVEVLGQGVFIPRSFSEIPLVCVCRIDMNVRINVTADFG